MLEDLKNKKFLITGASSGLGREICLQLSIQGAEVILVSRNKEKLQKTYDALSPGNHRIEIFDFEKDLQNLENWFDSLVQITGPLHGLVHSAGIDIYKPLKILELDDLHQILDINVNAAILLAKSFRKKNHHADADSSLVFISSIMGVVGQPGKSAYCASKGALLPLTKSLALELAKDAIRVNSILPGLVETEMMENLKRSVSQQKFSEIVQMHPLGIGKPIDVANLVLFLLSQGSRWITGSSISIDGGYTSG